MFASEVRVGNYNLHQGIYAKLSAMYTNAVKAIEKEYTGQQKKNYGIGESPLERRRFCRASFRAVSALGRLTENDDSDDPEEQKQKLPSRHPTWVPSSA